MGGKGIVPFLPSCGEGGRECKDRLSGGSLSPYLWGMQWVAQTLPVWLQATQYWARSEELHILNLT